MATTVVFKILFLILITHSFAAQQCSSLDGSDLYHPSESHSTNRKEQVSEVDLNKTQVNLFDKATNLSRERRQTASDPPSSASESAALVEDTSTLNQPSANTTTMLAGVAEQPANEKVAAIPPGELEERSGDDRSDPFVGQATTTTTTITPAAPSSSPATPVNYAELCYLSNGGSSITLTVNEATQVGSIIGTVEVNGDPSLERGNVDLTDEPAAAAQPRQQQQQQQQPVGEQSDQVSGTTGHPIQQVGGSKQRRVLYRRSSILDHDELAAANSNDLRRIPREPSSLLPPPPPQAAALAANQMLGLISDYQSSASGHSASFYSLVASTASPTPTPAQLHLTQPVKLAPGTRNLILTRPLDKESAEGEQSLVINVRCTPRQPATPSSPGNQVIQAEPGKRLVPTSTSTSPPPQLASSANLLESTTIPVRIIITDANDHAPEFIGQQPYVVNISETTPIGAVVSRDILAQDRDSAGPFSTLHYRVLEDGSAHSTLLQFANPLESTLLVAGQLDYESLPSFTITIVAQDEGEPEPLSGRAQVQVNIIDFDDQNPKFLDDKYTLVMDETQQNLVGQNLQVLPRNLYAEDGDRGIGAPILYSFDQLGGFQPSSLDGPSSGGSETSSSATAFNALADNEPNIEHYLHLNPTSGEIRLIREWPSKWMGSPLTLVVRATQADNKDRYTLTTLTITRPAASGSRATPTGSNTQQPLSGREELSSGYNDQVVATSATATTSSSSSSSAAAAAAAAASGRILEFVPNRLQIQVAENVAINEKIARVRARYKDAHLEQQSAALANADSQAVDLVSGQDWPNTSGLLAFKATSNGNKTRRTRLAELQQTASKRPINYQILGDQTDQSIFGINGLGEIFLKRHLDYEQRQEYKFQILATYTKSSDTCQVQVIVLNVNDNKPKFTQPQYNFHLTETRLRSNVIGNVLAHDADLNDTLHYSLIGEHAHLFEVNQLGQISLRESIKQLNITSCQLTVQVSDSLAPPLHTHQARINLHVAASLVGRSINFDHLHHAHQHHPHPHQQHQQDPEAKLFNSRNLIYSRASDSNQAGSDWSSSFSTASGGTGAAGSKQVGSQAGANANQRSSVATVMSSLQHMVRSVNFFDMPFSSALLLSALLAFLICLLLIVVVSMSVHLYRRRSKTRHRQQLAAAAHLRHAHMSAALRQPGDTARSRYLPSSGLPSAGNHGQPNNNGGDLLMSSSPNSSPTNSTGAGNSPTNFLAIQQPSQRNSDAASHNNIRTSDGPVVGAGPLSPANRHSVANMKSSEVPIKSSGQTTSTPAARAALPPSRNKAGSRLSQVSSSSPIAPLSIGTISGRLDSGPPLSSLLSLNETRVGQKAAEISLISTLSSQRSKRSYRSNTTDDSSVMHCGHYSVTASHSPQQQLAGPAPASAPAPTSTSTSGAPIKRPNSRQQSIEAAIKKLVRAGSEDKALDESDSAPAAASSKQKRRKSAGSSANSTSVQPVNELSVLTESKPGIKAYRKLVRAPNKVGPECGGGGGELAFGSDKTGGTGAISPQSPSGPNQKQHLQQQYEGLMAMIRDPELRSSTASQIGASVQQAATSERPFSPPSAIRWPQGVMPNRVKKLTWDDELSLNNNISSSSNNNININNDEDCFVAADIQRLDAATAAAATCSMSPLGSNHHYPVRAIESNEDQYAEQHFLFSNTCSPAPLSADYASFANAAGLVGAASATGGQHASYRPDATDQSSMLGQNNCFDYTIVQSSQFHVDAFASMERSANSAAQLQALPVPQSLSAQHHHLLQQQQQQHQNNQQRLASNYLYSNPLSSSTHQQAPAVMQSPSTNQDLTLITTAVL